MSAEGADRIAIVFRPSLAAQSTCEGLLGTPDWARSQEIAKVLAETPIDIAGHVGVYFPPKGSEPTLVGWVPDFSGDVSPQVGTKLLNKGGSVPGKWSKGKGWIERSFKQTFSRPRVFWIDLKDGDLDVVFINLERTKNRGMHYRWYDKGLGPSGNAFNCVSILPALFDGTSVDLSFLPSKNGMIEFSESVWSRSSPLTIDEFRAWFP